MYAADEGDYLDLFLILRSQYFQYLKKSNMAVLLFTFYVLICSLAFYFFSFSKYLISSFFSPQDCFIKFHVKCQIFMLYKFKQSK